LIMGALAVGSASAPLLVAWFGPRAAFVVAGAAIVLCGGVAYPFLRRLDARAELPDPARVSLLRSLAPFAPLTEFSLERAARALTPATASAGTDVVVQGDRGDRFYVIVAGDAVVERDGTELARLGPGDYFGEIALLRNVPRTATVTAAGGLDLLALSRRDFLGAITGNRPSAELANEEADRRLREHDAAD
jgi:CRP-like cAMP-binding protein